MVAGSGTGRKRRSRSRSSSRQPTSPGRQRSRTPQRPAPEPLELEMRGASARSTTPGRRQRRTRTPSGAASRSRRYQSPGRQQRSTSAGRGSRSPGRSPRSPFREWRCEWCGDVAPQRYNGPSGPASLCRTCGVAFQASWRVPSSPFLPSLSVAVVPSPCLPCCLADRWVAALPTGRKPSRTVGRHRPHHRRVPTPRLRLPLLLCRRRRGWLRRAPSRRSSPSCACPNPSCSLCHPH